MHSLAIWTLLFATLTGTSESAKPDPQKRNMPDDNTLKDMKIDEYIATIAPPDNMQDEYEDPEGRGGIITGECKMAAERVDQFILEEKEKVLEHSQDQEGKSASKTKPAGKAEAPKPVDFTAMAKQVARFSAAMYTAIAFWDKKQARVHRSIKERYQIAAAKEKPPKALLKRGNYMNIVELMQHGRDGEPLRRGDIIGCQFFFFGFQMYFDHFMIFLGQGANPFRNIIHVNVGNGELAMIRKASLSYYYKKYCRLHNYHLDNKPGYKVADPETIIERAEALEGCRLHLGHFDLIFYNCEDFANYARYGVKKNTQALWFIPSQLTDIVRGTMELGWWAFTLPAKLTENTLNWSINSLSLNNLFDQAESENGDNHPTDAGSNRTGNKAVAEAPPPGKKPGE
ncbi:lecithin retinol acyltransferase domain-containing protein [Ditylenchus destructor]|uniref:Lecithin retinol acyltransferase domain-containing protein n=1 Tax=Ditylenchus destructor TaxID=166010 RepID=A0AAD4MUI7_9BILA|nr:lecithin retinol acyltransferase domain-containing protein [Ditylenchus destructor]